MQFNEANPLAVSSLGIAARRGDENVVKKILKSGRRVDIGDNRGWTPIHEAAAANNIECLRLLLEKGHRYVNQRTFQGETPLMLACIHQNNSELVLMLLEHGADVDLGNNENHTPLHQACNDGKIQVAEELIAAGAKLNEKNHNNFTPIHCAVSSSNVRLVNYLIDKGADVNIQDECGRTPLFLASEMGKWEVVEPILKVTRSIDARAVDGATALMLAAQCGNLKIVEELLKLGANANLAAHDSTMAVHLAVHSGHLSVVELLLKVTSREAILFHCKDRNANCSLSCLAIDGECLDVLKCLLSSDLGNDILHMPVCIGLALPRHVIDYRERSPIAFLLSCKTIELKDDTVNYLSLLLKHGFPVNAKNSRSLPPLVAGMLDISHSDTISQCVDMLIAHGADIDYTSRNQDIPDALLAACEVGNCRGVLQLLQAGCNGTPDDLLYQLVSPPRVVMTQELTNMVELLMSLGITLQYLYLILSVFYPVNCDESKKKFLSVFYPDNSDESKKKSLAAIIAQPPVCSLQQLCRVSVRKCLSKPINKALEKLPLPNCVKNYIVYK